MHFKGTRFRRVQLNWEGLTETFPKKIDFGEIH